MKVFVTTTPVMCSQCGCITFPGEPRGENGRLDYCGGCIDGGFEAQEAAGVRPTLESQS